MSWLPYAILSAIFAAITAILAKIGIKDINSNLATAIRTVVILIFAWLLVFIQHQEKNIGSISKTSLVFLVLSGIATGLSWLFYFRALQLGQATHVATVDKLSLVLTVIFAAIFLHEKFTWMTALGAVLMSAGALVIGFSR